MKVDVGSNGGKGHTRQKKDEIYQKDNVTVHCEAGSGQNDSFDDDQDNGSVEVLAIQKAEMKNNFR